MAPAAATSHEQIDQAIAVLATTKSRWKETGGLPLSEREELALPCLDRIFATADRWIEAACQAKGTDPAGAGGAEEIMAGPLATARCLRLILQTLIAARTQAARLQSTIHPVTGRSVAPVFPTRAGLFDGLLFRGFRSQVWLQPGAQLDPSATTAVLCDPSVQSWPEVCLVLGAGNVSSIAPTDVFSKLFLHGRPVLLKMNPVNDYLGPIFADAFRPLLDAGCLRLVYGGAEVGRYAVEHPGVDEVHITGSAETYRRILYPDSSGGATQETASSATKGRLQKPITSELGNVTPWIVVPGRYSVRELAFQAENVAASITNNASFNCIATKMIVTHRGWPQREAFLDRVEANLQATPLRRAYYPGAQERFDRFAAGRVVHVADESQSLPWTLLRDVSPKNDSHLFREESFVCVTAETAISAESPAVFLERAVELANDQLWGTLGASLTVPRDFRRTAGGEPQLWRAIERLRYGTVAINHWSGLAFAWMSIPWGGYPGAPLDDPQSGIGWVHDVFVGRNIEKSVLEGPLVVRPKPAWFTSHARPAALARAVLDLYRRPNVLAIPRVLVQAMRG